MYKIYIGNTLTCIRFILKCLKFFVTCAIFIGKSKTTFRLNPTNITNEIELEIMTETNFENFV